MEQTIFPNEHGSFIDNDKERIAIELSLGKRKPQNDDEKELLAEIEQMRKDGKQIYIPFDI